MLRRILKYFSKLIISSILLILLAFCNPAIGKDFIVSDVKQLDFPKISTEFFFIDNNKIINQNLSQSDFTIYENGTLKTISSFDCGENNLKFDISAILSIDISASMDERKFQMISEASRKFFDLFPTTSELALGTFNFQNLLNQDFTNNISRIQSNLIYLDGRGSSSFNAALLNPPAGAFEIARNAKFKPVVILITDGLSELDINLAINKARERNLEFYAIIIEADSPQNLIELAKSSNGRVFENIDNSKSLEKALINILFSSLKVNPCKIEYDLSGCNLERQIRVEYKTGTQQFVDSKSIHLASHKLPKIEIINSNFFDFGKVQVGANQSYEFEIVSRNSNISLSNFSLCGGPFTILNQLPINLIRDIPKTITVRFQPADTLFHFCKISTISNSCNIVNFDVSGGARNNINAPTLNFIQPQRNEILISNSEYEIKWVGAIANEPLILEYSSNSGLSWNMITDNAQNESFLWRVPNITNKQYQLRLRQLSEDLKLEDVIDIDLGNDFASIIEWNNLTEKFAVASNNGVLSVYDGIDGKIERGIFSSPRFFAIDFSPTNNRLAASYQTADLDIGVWNTVNDDPPFKLKGNIARVNCITFSPNGDFIAAGLANGQINIWRLTQPNSPIMSFNAHNGAVTSIQWTNRLDMIISGGEDTYIYYWDSKTGQSLGQGIKYNEPIRTLKLANDGTNMVISTKSPNFRLVRVVGNDGNIAHNVIQNFRRDIHPNYFHELKGVDINADASRILSFAERYVQVWNLETGLMEYVFFEHKSNISEAAFSKDGRIASADISGKIKIWHPDDAPFERKYLQTVTSNPFFEVAPFTLLSYDINFGSFCLNSRIDSLFAGFLENRSRNFIKIDSIKILGEDGNYFSALSQFPIILKANEKIDINFGFSPVKQGANFGLISIYSDYNTQTQTVNGFGVVSNIRKSVNEVNFGLQNSDVPKDTTIIILENFSTSPTTIVGFENLLPNATFTIQMPNLPITLAAGQKLEVVISFRPEFDGRASGLFRFHTEQFCTPLDISLFGEGASPIVEQNTLIIDFGNNLCFNQIETKSVNIRNTGRTPLHLKGVEFDGDRDDFEAPSISQIAILPSQNYTLNFRYLPQSTDEHNLVFKLITNRQQNGEREIIIQLKGNKDSINIEFEKPTLLFDNVGENTTAEESVLVYNRGTIDYHWQLPIEFDDFIIQSANPQITTANGGESELIISFKGGELGNSYSQTFQPDDICNNNSLFISASIDINDAKIEASSNFEIIVEQCQKDSIEVSYWISNIGRTILNISDIEFLGTFSSDIFIVDKKVNYLIAPQDSVEIRVIYWLTNTGNKTVEMRLVSNAINYDNGVFSATLSIIHKNYSHFASFPKFRFLNWIEGVEKTDSFEFQNTLDYPIDLALSNQNSQFEIISVTPKIVEPGNSSFVEIKFNGGEFRQNYFDSLSFAVCDSIYKIPVSIFIEFPSSAQLRLPDIEAESGIIIPLKIYFSNPFDLDIEKNAEYEIELSFNANLLFPIDYEYLENRIENGRRYLKFNSELNIDETDSSIITLNFQTALGDTDYTDIEIISAILTENQSINLTSNKGSFRLTDVCYEGGARFIIGNGQSGLNQNYPNPIIESSTIEFTTIETGPTELALYDTFGNKIEILLNYISTGYEEKEYIFDATKYSSGVYYYQLNTPSKILRRKLLIVK